MEELQEGPRKRNDRRTIVPNIVKVCNISSQDKPKAFGTNVKNKYCWYKKKTETIDTHAIQIYTNGSVGETGSIFALRRVIIPLCGMPRAVIGHCLRILAKALVLTSQRLKRDLVGPLREFFSVLHGCDANIVLGEQGESNQVYLGDVYRLNGLTECGCCLVPAIGELDCEVGPPGAVAGDDWQHGPPFLDAIHLQFD